MAAVSDYTECFLLHRRAYRDHALLAELFSRDHGRVGAIAKTGYQKKYSSNALLQLFTPLKVQFSGKGDLLRVQQMEAAAPAIDLAGDGQICGFYVNELLMYSLQRHEPHAGLFDCYRLCLDRLRCDSNYALSLRIFELQLLRELGYAIDFYQEAQSHQVICANKMYGFQPLGGFYEAVPGKESILFQGEHLRAMASWDFSQKAVLHAAKRLTRLALQPLLNGRVIHSRQLLLNPRC